MALNIKTRYGARANDPSIDYPTGSIKNKSAPDATDGTPLEKDWANDWLGARDAILSEASIVANGNVEKVGASQVLEAIKIIAENIALSLPSTAGTYSSNSVFNTAQTFSAADIGKSIALNSVTATSNALPAANAFANGKAISFSNINTGIATFNRSGSDTITGGNLNAASSIGLNNGETVTLVSDGNSKWYVASSNIAFFGAPQTWQDFTASRVVGTTYTNGTGRKISINVSGSNASNSTARVTINGVVIEGSASSGATSACFVSADIPAGATYVVGANAGTFVKGIWAELR